MKFFDDSAQYINNLKTENGKSVLQSSRYAAFLGWLVNIKSLKKIYIYIVEGGHMDFLLTFKLSQDPLEIFFSSIRMSCGFANNPTSAQFKTAFQNLLCKTVDMTMETVCLMNKLPYLTSQPLIVFLTFL